MPQIVLKSFLFSNAINYPVNGVSSSNKVHIHSLPPVDNYPVCSVTINTVLKLRVVVSSVTKTQIILLKFKITFI